MKQTDAFPTPHRTKVVSFSLPVETADQIKRLAGRMGVSQSAMLAELLAQPIAAMISIIELMPTTGATAQDAKRAKGRSIEVIRDLVAEATGFLKHATTDASQTRAARRPRPKQSDAFKSPKGKKPSGRKR